MKFSCDKCHSKYSIDDERVAGRSVRIKCRKCGHIIEVGAAAGIGPGSAETASVESEKEGLMPTLPMPSEPPPQPRVSVAPSPIEHTDSLPASITREEIGDLLDEMGFAGDVRLPLAVQQPTDLAVDQGEWFFSLNDEPAGPLSVERLFGYYRQGLLAQDSLVWREGMEDWVALRNCLPLSGRLVEMEIAADSAGDASDSAPPFAGVLPRGMPAIVPAGKRRAIEQELQAEFRRKAQDLVPRGQTIPPGMLRNQGSWKSLLLIVVLLLVVAVLGFLLYTRPSTVRTVVEEKVVEKTRVEYRDLPAVPLDSDGAPDTDSAVVRPVAARSGKRNGDSRRVDSPEERKRQLLAQMAVGETGEGGGSRQVGSGPSTEPSGPGLSSAQTSAVVSRNRPGLKSCYEKALKKGDVPDAMDLKVLFKVIVGGSGMVKSVNLSGTGAAYAPLKSCLSASVKKWVFPTGGAESRVEFPLVFTPAR